MALASLPSAQPDLQLHWTGADLTPSDQSWESCRYLDQPINGQINSMITQLGEEQPC